VTDCANLKYEFGGHGSSKGVDDLRGSG
jgi:hypothetical protein